MARFFRRKPTPPVMSQIPAPKRPPIERAAEECAEARYYYEVAKIDVDDAKEALHDYTEEYNPTRAELEELDDEVDTVQDIERARDKLAEKSRLKLLSLGTLDEAHEAYVYALRARLMAAKLLSNIVPNSEDEIEILEDLINEPVSDWLEDGVP